MTVALYKIVTAQQEVELVRADEVDLNENNGRLNLKRDGNLVGSYVGYSGFSIVEEIPEVPSD